MSKTTQPTPSILETLIFTYVKYQQHFKPIFLISCGFCVLLFLGALNLMHSTFPSLQTIETLKAAQSEASVISPEAMQAFFLFIGAYLLYAWMAQSLIAQYVERGRGDLRGVLQILPRLIALACVLVFAQLILFMLLGKTVLLVPAIIVLNAMVFLSFPLCVLNVNVTVRQLLGISFQAFRYAPWRYLIFSCLCFFIQQVALYLMLFGMMFAETSPLIYGLKVLFTLLITSLLLPYIVCLQVVQYQVISKS